MPIVMKMVAAATLILALSACGSPSHATGRSTQAPASSAPPPPVPSSSPSSSTDSLTGPLGTTFTDTQTDSSGNADSYDVTAVKVLDPATGVDQYTTPDIGKRFIGVEFKITGDSGYSSDDANSDAVLQGDDGQVYQPDFDSISAGTNFNSGDFSVRSGQTQIGWVTFQLPRGVKVASVQWQPSSFGDQQPAIWTVLVG